MEVIVSPRSYMDRALEGLMITEDKLGSMCSTTKINAFKIRWAGVLSIMGLEMEWGNSQGR